MTYCSILYLVINFETLNLLDEGPTPGWDDPAVLARPRPGPGLAGRHHSRRRRPVRFAHPRRQHARDPARRRMQERPRQCSPPRHCPRAIQTRRHSSVAPVPTPSRSHSTASLSLLRSVVSSFIMFIVVVGILVRVRGTKQR